MDILGFLLTPTGIGVLVCAMIAILAIYLTRRIKPRKEVLYCRERDRRGMKIKVSEETAKALVCRSKKGPLKRFFKVAGSYVFNEGGKMVTRFFGKEGTAYTYKLEGSKNPKTGKPLTEKDVVQCSNCGETQEVELPVIEVGFAGKKLGSLKEALVNLWGNAFYSEIPKEQRDTIEENKVLVTVDLEEGLTPPGFDPIMEEDIDIEMDREAAKIFGKGLGSTTKQQLYQGMLWMSLGALIIFICYNIGVFS